MKTQFSLFCFLAAGSLMTARLAAQGVGVNTDGSAPDASALLDVKSTDRGLLVPRVSLSNVTSASPVTSPATGLLVYNTNASVTGGNGTGFYYWTGSQWVRLDASNSGDWRLTGNVGTDSTQNFLGTTDGRPFILRTNNIERLRLNSSGTGNTVLRLTGTASNLLLYNTAGVNLPTTGTRSTGTKVVWYPQVSGTEVDYATGIEGSTLWHSVPGTAAAYQHRFYAGTQRLMDIRSNNTTLLYGAGDNTFTAPANGFVTLNVEGNIFMPSGNSLWLGNTADAGDRFRFHHTGTDSYIDFATGFLQFRSGTTDRVRITAAGDVGIGTTAPATRLTVAGGISSTPTNVAAGATITIPANFSAVRITDDAANAANAASATSPQEGQYLTILNNDAQAVNFAGTTIPASTGVGLYQYINAGWRTISISSNSGGGSGWLLTGNAGTSPSTNFLGTTDAQALVLRTNNVERLRLLSNTTNITELSMTGTAGNMILYNTAGVNAPTTGTRSAGSKVVWYPQVSGTQVDYATGIEGSTLWHSVPGNAAGYQHRFYGGTQRLIDMRGNNQTLLYGTGDNTFTAPANGFVTLNVEGNIFMPSGNSLWVGNTADAGDRFRFHHSGTNSYIDYATGFLQIRSGITDRVRILSTGEVGIGTTTPLAQLAVARSTAGAAISWGVGATTTQHSTLQTDQGGSIELGAANSQANPVTNGAPYLDFHFGNGSAQNFNARIINNANNELRIQMLTSVKTAGSAGDQIRIGVASNGTSEVWINQPSPYVGDVFASRSDLNGDFAVNGYNRGTTGITSGGGVYGEAAAANSIGVWGYNSATNGVGLAASSVDGVPIPGFSTGISTMGRYYGIYATLASTATSVAGSAVHGRVNYTASGTDFTLATCKAAVKGEAVVVGNYTFGVFGDGGNSPRSGGVIGNDFGIARGALGYYASNVVDYSVYGFGIAYQTGGAGGLSPDIFYDEFKESEVISQPMTQIGMGMNGGIMGGWMNGLLYGFHTKGRKYALFADGLTYTNRPIIQLLDNGKENRIATFTPVSLSSDIIIRGKSKLENGEAFVAFPEEFISVAGEDISVTATPLSESQGIFISKIEKNGFYIKENNGGTSDAAFSWISVAERKDKHAHPEFDRTVISKTYDSHMSKVMVDDANPDVTAAPLWWDGNQLRFDPLPEEMKMRRLQEAKKRLEEAPKLLLRNNTTSPNR